MLKLLRVTFWSAVIFAFAMAIIPDAPEISVEEGDKLNHIIAFFTITLLGYYSYPALSRFRFLLAIFAFGAAIELVQLVPMLNRHATWGDLVADILASLAAFACARLADAFFATREAKEG